MRIEDFCEYNNHKTVTLAELETIFWKIKSRWNGKLLWPSDG